MIKKIITYTLILCFVSLAKAQVKNDTYSYIVVPQKFDFLKKPDSYRINTLLRYLFKQEGHTVYYDTEQLPQNRCNGIYADVKEINGGLFKSKLQIVIKNCTGVLIFESGVGESREKAYKDAYQEAMRMAFLSVQYAEITNDASLKENRGPAVPTASILAGVDKDLKAESSKKKETLAINAKNRPRLISENPEKLTEVLYAQKTDDGYQLVDKSPKIVMVLVSTAMDDVFLVKNQNAMVFKKDEKWYYTNSKGVEKIEYQLDIKF